ncbi:hypothetical protein G7Y79_00024g054970 [Physcia stellaris]|nr:hypothetical protein G7Y79_00024g054970 [Physcia stellaris]
MTKHVGTYILTQGSRFPRIRKTEHHQRSDMAKITKKSPSTKKMDALNQVQATSVSDLKSDPILLYKIQVLLYDLRNIANDHAAEKRTLSTTNELYLSAPYFTPWQADLVKGAIVEGQETSESSNNTVRQSADVLAKPQTVEKAIQDRLANFFEKRRASGDARPCGPHDMAPVYEEVFGIDRKELQDERFLSRLRRTGLGDCAEVKPESQKESKKGKGKTSR